MPTVPTYQPPAKPRGLLKWSFKLPVALYRMRLGWVLGHRFLLLMHRGRKTGNIHQVVLEVVHYDSTTQESVVLSAYGAQADWYRNIMAHPALAVRTGWHHYVPQQRVLDAAERFATLQVYERRNRLLFAQGMRFLGYRYDGTEAGLHTLADSVLMVAFRP